MSKKDEDLLPCPFCGADLGASPIVVEVGLKFTFECSDCAGTWPPLEMSKVEDMGEEGVFSHFNRRAALSKAKGEA